jgi:hypothetical protein
MDIADYFVGRHRTHEEPHTRTIEKQILDTLLRIEELLKPAPYTGEDITSVIKDVKPTETPFMKAAQAKPKGRK